MTETISFNREALRSLKRLSPRIEAYLAPMIAADPAGWEQFTRRLHTHFPLLFQLYYRLYSSQYDFFFHLEDLVLSLARAWFDRAVDLREMDTLREDNPLWFQSNQMLGGIIYVDLFSGTLAGVREKIPYFQELGLTYLHLMPLFKAPEGENDGGYAVSSYREVEPALGSIAELNALSRDLREAGISLVVDLVFNHTSDEHRWALRAKQGEEEYQAFYRIFPDRSLPDAYERTLREIFPDEHAGAFTFFPTLPAPGSDQHGAWVWTTFHSYQWDLNYANPAVFNRMAEEMLFLANQGVEVLRLDAVAFTWKEMGTTCENLPGAHTLIQAFNAVARIASPALLFKSEAIVHPDEVAKYIYPRECQLSYNPLLMALLWNTIATRDVNLLGQALATRYTIDPGCAWVNYVRCHDDIGWTFSDEDALQLGIQGSDHRRFLNEFYRGRFPGSFARGLPFQENPKTGDCRISGACASLAGLEKAIKEEGAREVELAIRRILLLHGMALLAGGIPLIYLGDEIGTLNDYSFRDDPAHERDSRWVHRPRTNWNVLEQRKDQTTIAGLMYQRLQELIRLRKSEEVFAGGGLEVMPLENPHILGFVRRNHDRRAAVLVNFSESEQYIPARLLEQYNFLQGKHCLHGISDLTPQGGLIALAPLDLVVIR
jgi:amylosucrase